jgi:hypothetical protein
MGCSIQPLERKINAFVQNFDSQTLFLTAITRLKIMFGNSKLSIC